MKNMKKWLAMLLLVVVAVTLTACGGDNKPAPTEAPTAAPTAAPTEAPAAPAETSWSPDAAPAEIPGNMAVARVRMPVIS